MYTFEKYPAALPYKAGDVMLKGVLWRKKPEPCVLERMALVSQNVASQNEKKPLTLMWLC